jgi:HAD superfamily hydrolase (TIGR01549 family)
LKKLILVDFHGTIVDANAAWYKAYCHLCPEKSEIIWQKIKAKEHRQEIADFLGVDYNQVIALYRDFLTVREDIIKLIKGLNLPIIIISNSSKERLMLDIDQVKNQHNLVFEKVYSGSDGKKPDIKYVENIIRENGYETAYMIGNDLNEDFIKSPIISNVLVPIIYF